MYDCTRYGDECWGGRVSLLHFMVIFLLAGVTILIVGAVQYKDEAELFKFRKIIITIGFSVLGTGIQHLLDSQPKVFGARVPALLHKVCLLLPAEGFHHQHHGHAGDHPHHRPHSQQEVLHGKEVPHIPEILFVIPRTRVMESPWWWGQKKMSRRWSLSTTRISLVRYFTLMRNLQKLSNY